MLFFVQIFYSKINLLLLHLVVRMPFSAYLSVEFCYVIFDCPILIVLLDPVSASFKFPFFHRYILIYFFYLRCQTGLQFDLVFSSQHTLTCFLLSTIACCHNLFICPCSLIFHPGFVFVFGFFKENIDFITDQFAPVYISSFNSLMQLVAITFCSLFRFLPWSFSWIVS